MNNVNLIWDADGTLVDSYDSITAKIKEVINHFDIDYDYAFIKEMVQRESTPFFYEFAEEEHALEKGVLFSYHEEHTFQNLELIKLMPKAKELLISSSNAGVKNFIYTHRGPSINEILKINGVENYFSEVVCSENGFPRKPNPEALNYLVEKYGMDKANTYYIGDRLLDQECARNAGIKAIYYHSNPNVKLNPSEYDYYIDSLDEIEKIIAR